MVDAIFAYGGLIRLSGLVNALYNIEEDAFGQERSYGDEELVETAVKEKWKDIESQFDIIPVKLKAYRRKYDYESPRGGTMLSVERTNPEDLVNGTLILGLSTEQVETIDRMEKNYIKEEVSASELETYSGFEIPDDIDNVRLYLADDCDKFRSDESFNPTYHARIIAGIEELGEMYGNKLGREFLLDFLKTTYDNGQPMIEKIDKDSELPYDIQPV
jgi:hypothetical protein